MISIEADLSVLAADLKKDVRHDSNLEDDKSVDRRRELYEHIEEEEERCQKVLTELVIQPVTTEPLSADEIFPETEWSNEQDQ